MKIIKTISGSEPVKGNTPAPVHTGPGGYGTHVVPRSLANPNSAQRALAHPSNMASVRAPQDALGAGSSDDGDDDQDVEETAAARTPDPAGTKPHSEGAALSHPSNASAKDSWGVSGDESLSEVPDDARVRQITGAESVS